MGVENYIFWSEIWPGFGETHQEFPGVPGVFPASLSLVVT